MAITNYGFNGKMSELSQARQFGLTGVDACLGATDWQVIQGAGRSVDVNPGRAFARGVLSESDSVVNVPIGAPVNGRWWLVVRRIDWTVTPRAVTIELVDGGVVGSTAVPTAPPVAYPVALNTNPGSKYDHVLAWAFVSSINTTVTIFDQRKLPLDSRMTALESNPLRGTVNQRDQYWGVPLTPTARRRLQDACAQWYDPSIGILFRYYDLYHATDNPGGSFVPGWFPAPGESIAAEFSATPVGIPSGADTVIGWNTGTVNIVRRGGAFSLTTGWVTIPFDGMWRIRVSASAPSTALRGIHALVNRTVSKRIVDHTIAGDSGGHLHNEASVSLAAGDEVAMRAYQNTGATQNFARNNFAPMFEIQYIGRRTTASMSV